MNYVRLLAALMTLFVISTASWAGTLWVPATADIYLAGQPESVVLQETFYISSDSAPEQAACEVTNTPIVGGSSLTFSVSGFSDHTPYFGQGPADGLSIYLITYDPITGSGYVNGSLSNQAAPAPFSISGQKDIPLDSLVGVFTGDDIPLWGTSTDLPESLDYNQIGYDFHSFSPELRQLFFIGDGMSSDGTVQEFVVPDGATRLFLGINDGPGVYNNNSGGFTVDVSTVPESSTILALSGGLVGLIGFIRRKA